MSLTSDDPIARAYARRSAPEVTRSDERRARKRTAKAAASAPLLAYGGLTPSYDAAHERDARLASLADDEARERQQVTRERATVAQARAAIERLCGAAVLAEVERRIAERLRGRPADPMPTEILCAWLSAWRLAERGLGPLNPPPVWGEMQPLRDITDDQILNVFTCLRRRVFPEDITGALNCSWHSVSLRLSRLERAGRVRFLGAPLGGWILLEGACP